MGDEGLEDVGDVVEVTTNIADLGRRGDEAKLDADVNTGDGELHMRHMLKLQSKRHKNVLTSPRLNICCGYISNVSYMLLP